MIVKIIKGDTVKWTGPGSLNMTRYKEYTILETDGTRVLVIDDFRYQWWHPEGYFRNLLFKEAMIKDFKI